MSEKRKCSECDWTGMQAEILTAPNPFADTDEIVGCPKCKAVECVYVACDEPGCWKEASCGTPTPGGYRSTCGAHRPKD